MNDEITNPDALDKAVDAVEEAEASAPDHLIGDFRFDNGETMKLVVPIGFTADQFETAVNVLTQMRLEAERRRAAAQPIITPDKPRLVGLDGRTPIASRIPD